MTQPAIPSPRLQRETLVKILRAISGVPVVWKTSRRPEPGPRPMGQENARILASIQSYQAIGVDERLQQFNTTTNQNDNLLVGQRKFTLVVQAESWSNALQAYDLCERVRFGFRTQRARSLMVPTLALVDFGPVIQHDEATWELGGVERTLLSATLDVRLLGLVASDPLEPNEGSWIQTVGNPTINVPGDGSINGTG